MFGWVGYFHPQLGSSLVEMHALRAIWAPDIEILLKRKEICQYRKTSIPYPMDSQGMFVINKKKYYVVWAIMTYIHWDILFHTSGIDYPHNV